MRILLTGAGGQLGLDLQDAFADVTVDALGRDELDVADADAVARTVAACAPDVVVNAAAWTDVDGCEHQPARAHAVNALGPWHLARACVVAGAQLMTVSTDYVLDGAPAGAAGAGGHSGRARRPLPETTVPRPASVYGRTKLSGERLVRATLPRHQIVRTAWLSGARGNCFVRTMLRLADERDELRVVDDQVGSPTTTRDLAAAMRRLADTGWSGTIHLVNDGAASWYELAAEVLRLAGKDGDVVLARQPSSALDRPAPRPAWSVLDGSRAAELGVGPLPHWRDALARLLDELGVLRASPAGPDGEVP